MNMVSKAGIDPALRPEDLTIEQYCNLTNHLVEAGVIPPKALKRKKFE